MSWRNSSAYKRWRTLVFKRDGFKCVKCGSQENLVSDHIKSADTYPHLRFVIANERTLCKDCHQKIGIKTPYSKLKQVKNKKIGNSIEINTKLRLIRQIGAAYYIALPKPFVKRWGLNDGSPTAICWSNEEVRIIPIE